LTQGSVLPVLLLQKYKGEKSQIDLKNKVYGFKIDQKEK
jgi:hypothetical protein